MSDSTRGRLAIVVGGGPAPGINGVISAVTIEAVHRGLEVVGIRQGFSTLVGETPNTVLLSASEVGPWYNRGGSILGTSRVNPAKDPAHMANVLANFEKLGVKYLVTIGGDDTAYSGSQVYAQAKGKIKVAHVPKTIDNDLPLPPGIPTFGFETARHIGVQLARSLHEDARTTGRWYIIISMGRAAGHLALGIGKAAAATLTLIREEFAGHKLTIDEVCELILGSMIKRKVEGKSYGLAILAEGLIESIGEQGLLDAFGEQELKRYGNIERDPHGHLRLGEIEFGRMVRDRLSAMLGELGLKSTMIDKDLGYELRCADPIPFDAEYTRDLGYGAVRFLLSPDADRHGAIVSMVGGQLIPLRFQDMIVPETKRLKTREVDVNSVTYECARQYMTRLEKEDFAHADKLNLLASSVKMTPDQFRTRFHLRSPVRGTIPFALSRKLLPMKLPVVAIVGRPNVGKSSLFNMLAGKRISIVEPTAGVTRDRITYTVEVGDQFVELMDTGGMGIEDHDNLTDDVEHQIRLAIEQAAVVLFVVDMRDGVMPLDEHVAKKLRGVNKPVIFVANKADEPKIDVNVGDLFRLGYGEPIPVSANSKRGRDDLLAAIQHKLPTDSPTVAPSAPELKVAIVGRRNVGKSTFINSLAESDRVIVSEVAGTTRDSIDVRFERDGKAFIAIDTAGVRKKKSLASDIEYYSTHRAERSIRRSDVVLHLFDPRLRISRVDKQLSEYILDNHKPAIFVVNKWDLAKDKMPTEKWADYLRKVFPMLDYVPIAFITATKGKNVYRLLNLAQQLHKQAGRRAKTGELNRVLTEAMETTTPPVRFNRVPKLYYAAQVATHPPTIIMVTNGPDLFDRTYVKFMSKVVRDSFEFGEVPIRLILKTKGEASAYSDRKAFLAAQAAELTTGDNTDEIPLLASEAPADDHDPVRVDEPDDENEVFEPDADADVPAAPPERTQEVPTFRPEPVKKKKKKPGTWDV